MLNNKKLYNLVYGVGRATVITYYRSTVNESRVQSFGIQLQRQKDHYRAFLGKKNTSLAQHSQEKTKVKFVDYSCFPFSSLGGTGWRQNDSK